MTTDNATHADPALVARARRRLAGLPEPSVEAIDAEIKANLERQLEISERLLEIAEATTPKRALR